MPVNVYIPTPYRRLTDGQAHVEVEDADTLSSLVEALEERHPGLKAELWAEDDFKHYVNVYVNGDEARSLGGKDTELHTGDEVAFVPMLAGGADDAFAIARNVVDGMVEHASREYP